MLARVDIKQRSLRSHIVNWVLRRQFRSRLLDPDFDPVEFRKTLDRGMGRLKTAPDVGIEPFVAPELRGEWNIPLECRSSAVILYCHGGGYVFGSPLSYRAFTTRLAKATGMRVLVLDYRLAPEHLFPAAADDVLAAYRYLLESTGAENIVLAGDSAGAGLSLSLLAQIKQHGLPMPAAAVLMSPYADLNVTGASLDENTNTCAMFSGDLIRRAAAGYLGDANPVDPRASPLYADYHGFPPLLIYVSDQEVLRDDSMRVAEKAALAGVPTELQVWHGQAHVWPLFVPFLPEANRALDYTVRFIQAHHK